MGFSDSTQGSPEANQRVPQPCSRDMTVTLLVPSWRDQVVPEIKLVHVNSMFHLFEISPCLSKEIFIGLYWSVIENEMF